MFFQGIIASDVDELEVVKCAWCACVPAGDGWEELTPQNDHIFPSSCQLYLKLQVIYCK